MSGSFFSPLVNVAKSKSIPSYEIGHALIWRNHPIYSINKIVGEESSALYYIDTEDAPLINRSLVTHKKVLKTNMNFLKNYGSYETPKPICWLQQHKLKSLTKT